jgi:hypothetical protein
VPSKSPIALLCSDPALADLARDLGAIRSEMLAAERHLAGRCGGLPEERRASACNLLHYLR